MRHISIYHHENWHQNYKKHTCDALCHKTIYVGIKRYSDTMMQLSLIYQQYQNKAKQASQYLHFI